MRRWLALAFLVTLSCIGGLGQDARAGVTVDVVFQDATSPSGMTIIAGDEGGHCFCSSAFCYVPMPGYCMEVILTTTDPIIGMGVSVTYDTDNGLALDSMYEWKGPIVGWSRGSPSAWCTPVGGLADSGGELGSFDCTIPEPNNPPVLAAGTYRVGTIVWDATGTTPGTEVVRAVFASDDGVTAVINGNVVDVTSSVVVRSHILNIIDDPTPVPSMNATGVTALGAAVFGIGIVSLVIAARRRRG